MFSFAVKFIVICLLLLIPAAITLFTAVAMDHPVVVMIICGIAGCFTVVIGILAGVYMICFWNRNSDSSLAV